MSLALLAAVSAGRVRAGETGLWGTANVHQPIRAAQRSSRSLAQPNMPVSDGSIAAAVYVCTHGSRAREMRQCSSHVRWTPVGQTRSRQRPGSGALCRRLKLASARCADRRQGRRMPPQAAEVKHASARLVARSYCSPVPETVLLY